LVIGHNGSRLKGLRREKPAGIFARFEREWKITNTNFDDDFSLEFEWEEEAGPFDINDIRLLVDTDGDFNDATVLSTADGLTFTVGSIIVGGIGTSHIPAGSTRYVTVASASSSTTLPIELLSFAATPTDNSRVILDWVTGSESNNDFFTIERSKDALDWATANEVAGAGNSAVRIDYTSIDENPYPGMSYYRLKQTDFDGQFSYSSMVLVNVKEPESTRLKIYPNPATYQVTLEGNSSELAGLKIYNLYGREVSALVRVIERQDLSLTIDISYLSNGLYTVQTNTHVTKLMKQ